MIKSAVTMATNYDSLEPMAQVKRRSAKKRENIFVLQPQLIKTYNSSMGDVDLLDQGVNNYRISIHGKKWWWVLFTHMINILVVYAWRHYTITYQNDKNMEPLMFQRNIVRHYLRSYGKAIQRSTTNRQSGSVPRSILQDPAGHFPQKIENQLRCRQCHMRARWRCEKCRVTLCTEKMDCFRMFHSENRNDIL
ncbi:hypothetical protein NQ314_004769 [Rhamnusium bicolor]|uniref:PiggyBac transposable element-derived protein domain-containing protein n=1 Tax=Rhamnusium bicolor TaxID=1586634 RepID=A0AAV8ZIC5_9CUCU|nr:hypothetical protein NQ314_004769 [Rhamnusium bicolor]